MLFFFFFKQKTAYEMSIGDWSSDVCSSDLLIRAVSLAGAGAQTGVSIEEFTMDMSVPLIVGSGQIQYQNVGFKNPVSLRQGERAVAGTTSIADKSVVVVISASTMK